MNLELGIQIEHFLAWLEVEKRYSPETLRGYQIDLEQFYVFLENHDVECLHDPNQIDRGVIRSFLGYLSGDLHLQARSVA